MLCLNKTQAILAGEYEEYRTSMTQNIACKQRLESLLDSCNGFTIPEMQLESIVAEFGVERVAFILANSLLVNDSHDEMSMRNRMWAKTVPVPQDGIRNLDYALLASPAMLDAVTGIFRRKWGI